MAWASDPSPVPSPSPSSSPTADGGGQDLSLTGLSGQLFGDGGPGWDAKGPGGVCAPTPAQSCIDAETIQVLLKQLLNSLPHPPDPNLLADLQRLRGARMVSHSTYLELSVYFDDSFAYVFPPAAPGAKPLPVRSVTLPKTWTIEASADGDEGLITLRKPDLDWRSSTLQIVPSSAAINLYVEQLQFNLLTSKLEIEAGVWDIASVFLAVDLPLK